MIQYLCDLCGKPIDSKGRLFKIKEWKTSWWESHWVELLAHDECVKAVTAAARERSEDDENWYTELDDPKIAERSEE